MSCPTCGHEAPVQICNTDGQWCRRCGSLWFGDWNSAPALVERVREHLGEYTDMTVDCVEALRKLRECVYPPEEK